MKMPNTIKSADLPIKIAALVLAALNQGKVELRKDDAAGQRWVVSRVDPQGLTYPEGWYIVGGEFRNKHNSTTGRYEEMTVLRPDGQRWQ